MSSPAPAAGGRLARFFGRLFGGDGRSAPAHLVDDGSLVVLARAFEVERGDAAVLEEIEAAGHDLAAPVLLRHIFVVHDGGDFEALIGGLQADGYEVDRPTPDRLRAF